LRAKLRRFLTSWLPVSSDRRGGCTNCGACCKLPRQCRFLRFRQNGESYCGIYLLRPPSCRKYPRAPSEFVTPEACGFYFLSASSPKLVRRRKLEEIPVTLVQFPTRRRDRGMATKREIDDKLRVKAS
jgi:hypothetical protein